VHQAAIQQQADKGCFGFAETAKLFRA
jgi:hypothetical protein